MDDDSQALANGPCVCGVNYWERREHPGMPASASVSSLWFISVCIECGRSELSQAAQVDMEDVDLEAWGEEVQAFMAAGRARYREKVEKRNSLIEGAMEME